MNLNQSRHFADPEKQLSFRSDAAGPLTLFVNVNEVRKVKHVYFRDPPSNYKLAAVKFHTQY